MGIGENIVSLAYIYICILHIYMYVAYIYGLIKYILSIYMDYEGYGIYLQKPTRIPIYIYRYTYISICWKLLKWAQRSLLYVNFNDGCFGILILII